MYILRSDSDVFLKKIKISSLIFFLVGKDHKNE